MPVAETQDIRITEVIAPSFWKAHNAIKAGGVSREGVFYPKTHFWLKGGRGSTKSSFAGIEAVLAIKRNPALNVVILRKVADTMRDSVYAQVVWAIGILGLGDEFKMSVSPMEIVYRPTGQRILFRGLDKAEKLKSLKVAVGYVGFIWFEEVDQLGGMREIRSVLQSLMRGGDRFTVVYSYNPPKSRDSWVNRETIKKRPDRIIHSSTYLDVPREWLGEAFITEAEELLRTEGKTERDIERDSKAYAHEYLGDVTGTGGAVFENVTVKELIEDEVTEFDHVHNGVDFGWFPDPWGFWRCHFDSTRRTLYVFDEAVELRATNERTAEIIHEHLTLTRDGVKIEQRDLVICDSAEPKSIADYRDRGIDARPVAKGQGSVEYGVKWLQSLREIVIDPVRCPMAAEEFTLAEYEQTRDGEYTTSLPDRNNHSIDGVRYAMSSAINRRQ